MPADRPNVLVFFVDQQRHDTTGVHGCPLNLTPNFDRLARAGTDEIDVARLFARLFGWGLTQRWPPDPCHRMR